MGLETGPRTKSAAALERREDGHLRTLKSTTSDEHTKQVDAGEDESDTRGMRYGLLSRGSRTGSDGNSLFC